MGSDVGTQFSYSDNGKSGRVRALGMLTKQIVEVDDLDG
jgi:hypothetical protein